MGQWWNPRREALVILKTYVPAAKKCNHRPRDDDCRGRFRARLFRKYENRNELQPFGEPEQIAVSFRLSQRCLPRCAKRNMAEYLFAPVTHWKDSPRVRRTGFRLVDTF